MLKFYYATEDNRDLHYWPFVYLHGEAEEMNNEAFAAGGCAPDLCVCDTSLADVIEDGWEGTLELACEVNGIPGVVVLSTKSQSPYLGSVWCPVKEDVRGRVVLASDEKALAHARRPLDWR